MARRGNGEGSITRHKKSGLYMARYWAETPTGPKRKTIYGKERKDVADKLAKALAERADGIVVDDENITVGDYLDRWLKGSVAGSVRQSTYDRYESVIEAHLKPAFGKVKLTKLTPMRVQSLYRAKLDEGLSPASVHKIHAVLHKALAQAVKWQVAHLERQLEEIQRLGDLYHDNGLVFANEVGNLINPTNLRKRHFVPLLRRAGLPKIRFHDLRHTCATLLFGRGVHPKYVQELLGHANISITLDRYSHAIPGMGTHTAKAMEDALQER